MAQQKGHLRVKGKPQNLSCYETRDGFLIRDNGGIDKNRNDSDTKFQRIRENGAEFQRKDWGCHYNVDCENTQGNQLIGGSILFVKV